MLDIDRSDSRESLQVWLMRDDSGTSSVSSSSSSSSVDESDALALVDEADDDEDWVICLSLLDVVQQPDPYDDYKTKTQGMFTRNYVFYGHKN